MYNRNLAALIYTHQVLGNVPTQDYIDLSMKIERGINFLIENLGNFTGNEDESEFKSLFYDSGKIYLEDNLRLWFECLYIILLRKNTGNRIWTLCMIIGIDETINKLYDVMNSPIGVLL